jgi:hypothetical protein
MRSLIRNPSIHVCAVRHIGFKRRTESGEEKGSTDTYLLSNAPLWPHLSPWEMKTQPSYLISCLYASLSEANVFCKLKRATTDQEKK